MTQQDQLEYFEEISNEYDLKYTDAEDILKKEKARRLQAAINMIAPKSIDHVVEIGVGSGEFFSQYQNRNEADLIGVDLSSSMIETARSNEPSVEYSQGDITSLPLSSNSVDLAVCLGVLGYVPKQQLKMAITELSRILAPGGQLIFSFANRSSPYRLFRQFYYYYLLEVGKKITGLGTPVTSGYNTYMPQNIKHILEENGLQIEEEKYLTYSTGIWNTSLNIKIYTILENALRDKDLFRQLAMTWIIDARR
jgi:ubiquinone/menaquinone biosynthesis C-methylase UbiE